MVIWIVYSFLLDIMLREGNRTGEHLESGICRSCLMPPGTSFWDIMLTETQKY
jgi:hypothetical protein